jgi:phosphoglycerol transferase MdoB-like AlkP superfamily enzyme
MKFIKKLILPEIRFAGGLYCLLLVVFAGLRLLLLWRNDFHASGIPVETLAKSFLVGMRFDLAISSYLMIPLFIILLILPRRRQPSLVTGFCALIGVLILTGLAEIEFYRELEMRFNTLVFEYLSHPRIVAGMAWEGYPVLSYLLAWVVLFAAFTLGVRWLYRRTIAEEQVAVTRQRLTRMIASLAFLSIMVVAARGGLGPTPLRWGDAFFCEEAFANNLALNGVYTLGRSAIEKLYGSQRFWTNAMPREEALRTTRSMLFLPDEQDLSTPQLPLLRKASVVAAAPRQPVNVVVILGESFSGRHVGALGANPSLTPDFDALSRAGVLFDHAFSNGTHTHQGVFASLAGFPNLPGYEYLMKTMEAHQEFSGLPSVLTPLGYDSLFLYNGLFSWDNKEGFFRQHGMHRFIGRNEYVNPTFVDPVWGVGDYDVFMRANDEFRVMAEKGPFFGAILTLTNHSPYTLPNPLPFERIKAVDIPEGRADSMRYADWALGEFFRKASQEKYFQNTLFVITGDHGFGSGPGITAMQLGRFHVPLLFYAPALWPEQKGRRSTVASQVDIGPSVLGLLGLDVPHQGWGRNLFSKSLTDPGFAVVKPSGGKEEVALIEGNYLLMRTPKEKPRLYRYDLNFPPFSEQIEDPRRIAAMDHRLKAYVQTGLLNLRGRQVGLPR